MFSKSWRVAALSLLVATPALAQIDQQQTAFDMWRYTYYSGGQSFTPTMNTSTGAGVYTQSWGYPFANFTMITKLWDNTPYAVGSNELASATVNTSYQGYEQKWVDATWATPVALTPGNTYFLSFTGNTFYIEYGLTDYNSYVGGNLTTASTQGEVAHNLNVASYDLAFREFGENDVVNTTPEPATFTLFATGAAGLLLMARRRKRSA